MDNELREMLGKIADECGVCTMLLRGALVIFIVGAMSFIVLSA